MNSYNVHLYSLRNAKGLTLKELAKEVKINRFQLYLYENGYFRPRKKHIELLESYYQEKISIEGEDAYPTPIDRVNEVKQDKKSLFIKRVVSGSIAAIMAVLAISGGVLFYRSVHNEESYYGEIYNRTKEKVIENGTFGYDIVTSLGYYTQDYTDGNKTSNIIFYKTDSLIYFNECIFSETYYDVELFTGRYHYKFGSNLGVDSFVCYFSYGSFNHGTFFTCDFIYEGKEVTEINNFNIRVKGDDNIDESLAIKLVNSKLSDAETSLSTLLTNKLGENVSFYNDFLPAREAGRIVNYKLQIIGISFIMIGILLFFVSFGYFLRMMIVNIKPRLVATKNDKTDDEVKPLPKDITISIGAPDKAIIIFARVMTVLSVIFIAIGLLTSAGILPFASFFGTTTFASIARASFVASVFLAQFVSLVRVKRPSALLKIIINNLFLFLAIATIETVVILITNDWGFDLGSLVYSHIPGNVFEIVAVHYIIFLFLFFEPPFLNKSKKFVGYLWHGLSLIPLGFLILTYFQSNAYNLTYGVKENIFINFWFPNGYLPLSIVSALFLYTIFGLRLFFERRYGIRNAHLFFYGDLYNLIEKSICCFYILLIGLLDLLFIHNQIGYYLGLGINQWIYVLIPFIFICKYSPNNQQTLLLEDRFTRV